MRGRTWRGLPGWFNNNLRGKKGQQGFTLIELLVVVTILGILAAIVTLSLIGLSTTAVTQSCNQEARTVQTALDALMADNSITTVTAVNDSNDMGQTITTTGLALWVDLTTSTTQTHNYTRNRFTRFYYSWDSVGRVTNVYSDATGGTAPNGCNVLQ